MLSAAVSPMAVNPVLVTGNYFPIWAFFAPAIKVDGQGLEPPTGVIPGRVALLSG
ncbi:MAG: hypothetical protein ACR2PI_04590 [Hyphomicrobiaceae bacterium]